MESKEMQRIRYRARKYGLRCLRVAEGYRFYSVKGGALVDSVNGLPCNSILTRAGVETFLDDLTATQKQVYHSAVATVNVSRESSG